jgi:hypothetical protein
MELVPKIVFWGLLAVCLLPMPIYSMEQLSGTQEPALSMQGEPETIQEKSGLSAAAEPADRRAPILEQDHDARILWGNIAAVMAFALVVSYAFYQ